MATFEVHGPATLARMRGIRNCAVAVGLPAWLVVQFIHNDLVIRSFGLVGMLAATVFVTYLFEASHRTPAKDDEGEA